METRLLTGYVVSCDKIMDPKLCSDDIYHVCVRVRVCVRACVYLCVYVGTGFNISNVSM